MDFDLRTLRYATALARHDSFTRAAEALGISQPTLSRAILDLEQSLGGRLFDRGRHGAEATPLGHVLIERAQVLLDEVDQLQNELQQALDPTLGETVLVAGRWPLPSRSDAPAVG